ncbi:MAG TPA: cysteine hydrolase family protein [Rhodocyclaceae bacterium]|nr:cysteine hydrolase family protein [Rhodocyclaceae bacterium]
MKTLRQWAGVMPPTSVDCSHTALLLVDFQREYFDGKLPIPDGSAALSAAKRLVKSAEKAGVFVVHIHHVAASPTAPLFASGSSGAEPVDALRPAEHHAVVIKRLPSSFAGTELLELLRQRQCNRVIVCGLMTHNCVDATTRDALHLGFAPIVVGDASATRDLPGVSGGAVVPAQQLHRAVLAGLADRIADVMTCDEVVALLARSKPQ